VKQSQQPSQALPGVAAIASVGILLAGNWLHVSRLAVGLTVATLTVAGLRTYLVRRELPVLTRTVHRQAATDDLTGLANRRRLMAELERRFSRTGSSEQVGALALLMIDLDHFKEINDSFGHPTGDWLLQQIGLHLAGATRADDVVARLGGDEFAIVFTGADVEFATDIAQRITSAIAPPFVLENTRLHVGASIGIALAPEHASDAIELMRCADVAMYRAKSAHCDFDVYEPSLDDGADRLKLMEELRGAIDSGGLALYYQPPDRPPVGRDRRHRGTAALAAPRPRPHSSGPVHPPRRGEWGHGPTHDVRPRTSHRPVRWVARSGAPEAVPVNISTTNLLDTGLPDLVTT
jgi:diguanylate cyclase (GGDEF)-like protein